MRFPNQYPILRQWFLPMSHFATVVCMHTFSEEKALYNIYLGSLIYRLLTHYICLIRRKSLCLHIEIEVQLNTKLTMEDLLLTILFFIALRALLKGIFGGKSTFNPDK